MSKIVLTDRASRVPVYVDCARRWAALRFWPEGYGLRSRPKSIAMVAGSCTHTGQEVLMREFMDRGAPSVTAARGVQAALEQYLSERAETDFSGDIWQPADAEKGIAHMVGAVHAAIDPEAEPELVERGMRAQISNSAISCTVDLFLVAGVLDDLKSSVRKPQRPDIQMGIQSSVTKANLGAERVGGVRMSYLPRVPAGKRQPPVMRIPLVQAAAEQVALETIQHMERAVTYYEETGDPAAFTANPASHLCSAKYCPAFGSRWCSAWKLKPEAQAQ